MASSTSHPAIRVFAITGEWPAEGDPKARPWVATQVAALRRAGLDVEVLPFRGGRSPAAYLRGWRHVHQALRSRRFDLVHAHFGWCGLLAIPSPVPLVVSFYGSDLEGIVATSGHYTAFGRLLRRVSRVVARVADAVVVVSPSLAGRLPSRVRCDVIPMAVDLRVFTPGDRERARSVLGLPSGRKLVLFSGDPDVAVKRFALARAAVETLRDRMDVELLTVSAAPPPTVRDFMVASNALLVTSLHEGSPAMVREAIACGLPVASVDVGDVAATIGHLDGCAIATGDSPAEVATALQRVLESEGPFDWKAAAQAFDADQLAARMIDLYHRTIEAKER